MYVLKKDSCPGGKKSLGKMTPEHKKSLQREILIAEMNTSPEGSTWQDPTS
jgi:hypothetical protein